MALREILPPALGVFAQSFLGFEKLRRFPNARDVDEIANIHVSRPDMLYDSTKK